MATSVHRAMSRAAFKIVETQDLVLESLTESVEGPRETEVLESKAELAALKVPSNAGEFLEATVKEDGGATRIGTRRSSQHQYRAVLHEAIVRVAGALDSEGVCDKNGRLRRSWLSELQGLIREAREIDQLLGLDRETAEPAAPAVRRTALAAHPDPADGLPAEIEAFLDQMDD